MNKYVNIIILVFIIAGCSKDESQSDTCKFINFKYYYNTPETIGELSSDFIFIGVDSNYTDDEIHQFISSNDDFDQNYNYLIINDNKLNYKGIPLKLNESKTCDEITSLIENLKTDPFISYAHYILTSNNCPGLNESVNQSECHVSYSNYFIVKVVDENNLSDLYRIVNKTGTKLIGEDEYTQGVYYVSPTKSSKKDALYMANYFSETHLFEFSEPNLIYF